MLAKTVKVLAKLQYVAYLAIIAHIVKKIVKKIKTDMIEV